MPSRLSCWTSACPPVMVAMKPLFRRDGGPPAQQPALDQDDAVVDDEAEHAERHDARVQLGAAVGALREQDVLAEPRLRSLHLGHDCEDEADREADPRA